MTSISQLIQKLPWLNRKPDSRLLCDQRMKHRIPIRKPLLLISQIQRSGGTLLSQLMDGHSQLYAQPGELNIGKPKKWDYPVFEAGESSKAVFRRLKERTVQRYVEEGYQKQSGAQAKYDTNYEEKTKPFLFSMSLQERLFCKFMEDFRAKSRRDVLDVYVSSYFNAWLDYQDLYRNSDTVKYWSVFSARLGVHANNAESILKDYPDGRIVVMFRNPVNWYASAREHSKGHRDAGKAMSLWLSTYRNALEYRAKYPASIHVVEFESLVQDVPGCMRKLCGILGLEFSESLCVPTFNRMPIESDSSFGAKEGIDASAVDRSGHVADEEKQTVFKLAGDVYDGLKSVALK